MHRNIFEYAATDKFLLLFLTGANVDPNKLDGQTTVHRKDYDPDIVAMIEAECEDDLGIPDIIACTGVEFNLDDEDRFHGFPSARNAPKKSFQCNSMTLTWLADGSLARRLKHREDGPASVEFTNLATTHLAGLRKGFRCSNYKFNWYTEGELVREAGPHSVFGDTIDATMNSDGSFRLLHSEATIRSRISWNHPTGEAINVNMLDSILREHKIEINRYAPGASVFPNSMEQMIFYSVILNGSKAA